jgi:Pyruvate/2-oxoacid:ferredoxin oxidoreductase delta subunit
MLKKKRTKIQVQNRRIFFQDRYKMSKGCEICGYNKHPKALSFDHLIPGDKHPLVKNGTGKTNAGGMWQLTNPSVSIKVMIAEWRKCRILCMNCHMEDKYAKHTPK